MGVFWKVVVGVVGVVGVVFVAVVAVVVDDVLLGCKIHLTV